jgi:transposase
MGEHRARHRFAVPGTVRGGAAKAGVAADRVDEIYQGKKDKFLTVVCDLQTGEPVWFGRERKQETLDEFFRTELNHKQRQRIEAACVDMWEPFRMSIEQWAPQCRIVYDKFHIMQHANDAVDEVRRAEFFRKGKQGREVIKGKRWLLLSRWENLSGEKRGQLNELFGLNRRCSKLICSKRAWTGSGTTSIRQPCSTTWTSGSIN